MFFNEKENQYIALVDNKKNIRILYELSDAIIFSNTITEKSLKNVILS